MVAVLCVQQLFSAYHMLTIHADENAIDRIDGHEWVVNGTDPCDLCAKLNTQPAVQFTEFLYPSPAPNYFSIQDFGAQLTSDVGYNTQYRRGPPSLNFCTI